MSRSGKKISKLQVPFAMKKYRENACLLSLARAKAGLNARRSMLAN
jgi:hypothetical protein